MIEDQTGSKVNIDYRAPQSADVVMQNEILERSIETDDFENRGLFETGSAFSPEGKPRVLKFRLKTRGGSECMSQ